jgi:hypothetical protein
VSGEWRIRSFILNGFSKRSKKAALLHNSQAVDNKNEFLWHFYNNFRLSQGQLKTYATTPKKASTLKNLRNVSLQGAP